MTFRFLRRIGFILEKEFRQIFRNRLMIPIIFVMPVVQLFLLSYAANFEIKNLKLHLIDLDLSPASQRLQAKLEGSQYFIISSQSFEKKTAYLNLEKDKSDVVLVIPSDFQRDLIRYNESKVQLLINAIDGTKAGLANAYLNNIIGEFNNEVILELIGNPQLSIPAKNIVIDYRNWFNPTEDYKIFMVPGILVLLVTMISMFLSGINIVREKEIGTIEQLNVTTIKKYEFIIGKLLPFWLLAILELSIGLLIAWFIFEVPMRGSLWLIYSFAFIYAVAVLGLGILISTFTNTQQQSMFISWFFLVIFILMSGLFTPIENMPAWAQFLTKFNPIAYFIQLMRMVMLKGSVWQDVSQIFIAMAIYALVTNTLAVWNYQKTTG